MPDLAAAASAYRSVAAPRAGFGQLAIQTQGHTGIVERPDHGRASDRTGAHEVDRELLAADAEVVDRPDGVEDAAALVGLTVIDGPYLHATHRRAVDVGEVVQVAAVPVDSEVHVSAVLAVVEREPLDGRPEVDPVVDVVQRELLAAAAGRAPLPIVATPFGSTVEHVAPGQ